MNKIKQALIGTILALGGCVGPTPNTTTQVQPNVSQSGALFPGTGYVTLGGTTSRKINTGSVQVGANVTHNVERDSPLYQIPIIVGAEAQVLDQHGKADGTFAGESLGLAAGYDSRDLSQHIELTAIGGIRFSNQHRISGEAETERQNAFDLNGAIALQMRPNNDWYARAVVSGYHILDGDGQLDLRDSNRDKIETENSGHGVDAELVVGRRLTQDFLGREAGFVGRARAEYDSLSREASAASPIGTLHVTEDVENTRISLGAGAYTAAPNGTLRWVHLMPTYTFEQAKQSIDRDAVLGPDSSSRVTRHFVGLEAQTQLGERVYVGASIEGKVAESGDASDKDEVRGGLGLTIRF